ncbi:MAG: hypothetical protein GX345_00750 [Clostridiales bacterium]|jgi:hypothetical protein|nr:hypothetical protein [Clostridiales bacterium]
MLERMRKFIENNRIFIPIVGGTGAVLLALLLGVFIMQGRLGAIRVEHEKSLAAFSAAEDKLYAANMEAFEKTLFGSFNEEQLVRIAKKNIRYGISINGKSLGKNESIVYSRRPTVAVLLSENYGKESLNQLPRNIIEMGSIMKKENAKDLMQVTFNEYSKMENNIYDYYYGNTLSYLVSDIKPGDIITLEIAPEIARLMEIEDNIIEVIYNKDVDDDDAEIEEGDAND